MKKYVIIGNGAAAVGCVEGIRSVDAKSPITIISEENHHVYGRPLISYYLKGDSTKESMLYRPNDFYEANGCEVLYGVKATAIKKGKVSLSKGKAIAYDELCVATGSRPFVPPFKGLDTVENKYSFMTLDDATALECALDKKAKVLVIGAGLIGLKCVEGIYERVGEITVCDLADRVLSSILDSECASIVQSKLEAKGINFMLGDSVAEFDGSLAIMNSGAKVDFDILVLAVGVRANTELVSEAGGSVNRGIVIDNHMATTVNNVYAAGDCTISHDITSDSDKVLAIMPNAYLQGYCAGQNMAGEKSTFDNAIPMNSIGFFGYHIMSAGSYDGELYEEKTADGIKRLYTKDGYMTGFMILGDVAKSGIYTNIIRKRIPLSEIDYEVLKKEPSLAPLGASFRDEFLAMP